MKTDLAVPEIPPFEYLDDGTLISRDGEVVELDRPDVIEWTAANPPPKEIADRFVVDSEDAAEWVLDRLMNIESNHLEIEAKRSAINANLDRIANEVKQHRKWWEFRFTESLVSYARQTLGKKTKTRKFTNGSVAFRTSSGRREVLLKDEAIAFVHRWTPHLIRREVLPVRLEDIETAIEAAVEATGDESYRNPVFLLREGEKTTTTISTGIPKLEKKK